MPKSFSAGKPAISAASLPSGIDAAKIADGSVSNAEFQRLDGVSSNIQTQISARLVAANNLSDVADAPTARTNLGITPGITNSAGADVVMKSDGTNAVASQITDDGTPSGVQINGNKIITQGDNFDATALTASSFSLAGLTIYPPLTSFLATDYTNSTAGFTNTALNVTLPSNQTFKFELQLFASNTQAAEGFQIDFAGGSLTPGYFRAGANTSLITGVTNSVSTAFSNATLTGVNLVVISGYIESDTGGTFIVRGRENTSIAGTLTFQQGSSLIITRLA